MYESVKLTKLQTEYIHNALVFLQDADPEQWDNDDLANGALLAQKQIAENTADDGTCIVTVTPYLIWRTEADAERMHPSQSDNDWVSVQEYTYSLRFYRKLCKAAGIEPNM